MLRWLLELTGIRRAPADRGGVPASKKRRHGFLADLERDLFGARGDLGLLRRARKDDETHWVQIHPEGTGEAKPVQPASRTPTQLTYRLGGADGLKLRAGEELLLEVPADCQGRFIYQAILEHRQVQSEKTSAPKRLKGKGKPWDQTPGITALHFHTKSGGAGGGWRYWHAPWGGSGEDGGKYAEIREDWEMESHFDFAKNGTAPVGGGRLLRAPLKADALRLRGVGTDPTFVRQVVLTFAPPEPDEVEEHVFTPGTHLGDLLTARGQVFGKDYEKGTFPSALVLFDGGEGGEGSKSLPGSWSFDGGRLSVPLKAGMELSGVEIACGDTKPDGIPNSDGAIGSQGRSKLQVGVQRGDSAKPEWFMEDQSVPPQGVIFAGPKEVLRAQPGDRLVFSATIDPTYVMALRIGYTKPAE